MTVTLPMMKQNLERPPFQLAKGPGTAKSEQVLGEKLFHTPVVDKLVYERKGLQNVRVVDVGTGIETAVKVFRGLPSAFARELRYQEKRYLSGGRVSSPLWKRFFDDIPQMKEARHGKRMNDKAREAIDMVAIQPQA